MATQDKATPSSAPDKTGTSSNNTPAGDKVIKQTKTIVYLRKGDMRIGEVSTVLDKKGAFIDIGVGKDGFLPKHLLKPRFRHRPQNLDTIPVSRFLRVGEKVRVWIQRLDRGKNDIRLTMIRPDFKPIKQLQVGEMRNAIVRTVMDYGAFVDIGSDKDALLPISRLAREPVTDIHTKLKEDDELEVWVSEVKAEKGEKWQINVSCLAPGVKIIDDLRIGDVVTGTVSGFSERGALLDLDVGVDALLPLKEIEHFHVVDAAEEFELGQEVEVLIVRVSNRTRHIEVSRKRLLSPPADEDTTTSLSVEPDLQPMSTMEMAFMKARQKSAKVPRKRRKRLQNDGQDDLITRMLQADGKDNA